MYAAQLNSSILKDDFSLATDPTLFTSTSLVFGRSNETK